MQVAVQYNGPTTINNIQIMLALPKPFRSSQKLFVIESLSMLKFCSGTHHISAGGLQPQMFTFDFWITRKYVPSSLTVLVIAVYLSQRYLTSFYIAYFLEENHALQNWRYRFRFTLSVLQFPLLNHHNSRLYSLFSSINVCRYILTLTNQL